MLPAVEEAWFKTKLFLLKLTYFKKRSRLKRYGFTILLILLTFAAVLLFPRTYFLLVQSPTIAFLILIFIVTLSSWIGGIGPGLLATLITSIMNYFFILIKDNHYHPLIGDVITSLIYLPIGVAISIISEARYESEIQKDEFIALTAHELKNPLTIIRGFSQIISLKTSNKKEKKISFYAKQIESQSDKLLELINDLLDVTKIEIGKFTYKKEAFNIDQLLEETIASQQVISKKRQITLLGRSKKIIFGDRYRIRQVIVNLISNALKYSPEDSKVEVKIKAMKDGVLISVRDWGTGIAKDDQKKIFSQYYRVNRKSKKTEGLGLGLFISSLIVKEHQGKLWVKSKPGHGSIFFLTLPVHNS